MFPLAFYTQLGRVVYRKLGPPILALIGPFYAAYAVWFLIGRRRPIEPDEQFRHLYHTSFGHLVLSLLMVRLLHAQHEKAQSR